MCTPLSKDAPRTNKEGTEKALEEMAIKNRQKLAKLKIGLKLAFGCEIHKIPKSLRPNVHQDVSIFPIQLKDALRDSHLKPCKTEYISSTDDDHSNPFMG